MTTTERTKLLRAVDTLGPSTTREIITEALGPGCSRTDYETARAKLYRLAKTGDLRRRTISAQRIVWERAE